MFAEEIVSAYAGALVIVGAFLWIGGYKMWKALVYLTGFFMGVLITFLILGSAYGDAAFEQPISLLVALLGGIAGAYLMMLLVKVYIFIIGFAFGFTVSLSVSLGQNLFDLITAGYVPSLGNYAQIAFIIGVIAGIAALFYNKIAIILITSFWGSEALVGGASIFWYLDHYTWPPAVHLLLAVFFLTIIGFAIQWRLDAATPTTASADQGEQPTQGSSRINLDQPYGQAPGANGAGTKMRPLRLAVRLPNEKGAMLSLANKAVRTGQFVPKVLAYHIDVSYEVTCLNVTRGRLFVELYVHYSRGDLWERPIARHRFDLQESGRVTLTGKELLDPTTNRMIRSSLGGLLGIQLIAEFEGRPAPSPCTGRPELRGEYTIHAIDLVAS